MKKKLYGFPEEFTSLPLLSLLPVAGDVAKLEGFTSSLFARYEKVSTMQKELPASSQGEGKKLNLEREMLREVLEWLAVNPEEDRE